MIRSFTSFLLILLFLSGCGASIDSLEAYTPVPLENSAFMPTKEEIKSGKTKVILTPINDASFMLAQKANLGQSLYVELERQLSTSGTVEILDRTASEKFEKEIRLSELNQASKMSEVDLFVAKYAISGSLSNAQFVSRFVETQRWQDKEGKTHIIPAHYIYTASVSGILKIYAIPSMKVLKTIEFSDSARRTGDIYYPADVGGMLNQAGRSAIHSTRHDFKNYLAPKGYIMQQRSDGEKKIVQVNIGKADGLETGEEVDIYSVRSNTNPFTQEEEVESVKIAKGLISDKLNAHHAWIIIEEQHQEIKLGDYIKANYSKEFFDYVNDFAKEYSGMI